MSLKPSTFIQLIQIKSIDVKKKTICQFSSIRSRQKQKIFLFSGIKNGCFGLKIQPINLKLRTAI